jgi:tetratricopeptide (TPR) repeat protein
LHATTLLCDYLNRWNEAGPEEVAKAEAAVLQALGSNPSHGLAHYAKGFVHRTKGEHDAALAAFTETLKHVPNFARAHAQRGAQLLYLGRPQEAIAEVEKALEISPRSAQRGMFYWIIGRARFFMGQYAEAIPWLRRSIRLWPHLWYNRLYLASAYALAEEGPRQAGPCGSLNANFQGTRFPASRSMNAQIRTTTPLSSPDGTSFTRDYAAPA